MNKTYKVFISVIAACNVIFNLFTPLALTMLLLVNVNMNWYSEIVLIITASLSTLYKSIEIAGIDTIEYIVKESIKKRNK